ncbi:MAG: hypothetical protein EBV06_08235 [Planctomycetia bacterium]|nr:hypothetical protein [Planctomycetia bacterium]
MMLKWKHSLAGLALALGLTAQAQEAGWRAVPISSTPSGTPPIATIGRPIATLGRPVANRVEVPTTRMRQPIIRAAMDEELPFPPPPPYIQVVGIDPILDSGPSPTPSLSPAEPLSVNWQGPPDTVDPPTPAASAVPASPPDLIPGVEPSHPVSPTWWGKWSGWVTWGDRPSGKSQSWASDNCMPGMISPITMPFLFEDPRALTEIRPIFMYQSIPGSTPGVGGGNAWFFGTQARLAFDDRFSLVLNELGMVGINPSNKSGTLQSESGFAEIKIGPKYTFLKYSDWGSVAAAGLTFDLPVGGKQVYQNVGSLGLTPYLSYGQTFGRLPGGFGSLNFMGTTGYSASINNERSEYFFLNLHLDYNIANSNSFFPTLEFNWIKYTKAGRNVNFGFEGADLINFGSQSRQGSNYFTVAPGLRYRFSEHIYAGAAIEIPFSQEKGLNDYRLTFDMIFRY